MWFRIHIHIVLASMATITTCDKPSKSWERQLVDFIKRDHVYYSLQNRLINKNNTTPYALTSDWTFLRHNILIAHSCVYMRLYKSLYNSLKDIFLPLHTPTSVSKQNNYLLQEKLSCCFIADYECLESCISEHAHFNKTELS